MAPYQPPTDDARPRQEEDEGPPPLPRLCRLCVSFSPSLITGFGGRRPSEAAGRDEGSRRASDVGESAQGRHAGPAAPLPDPGPLTPRHPRVSERSSARGKDEETIKGLEGSWGSTDRR